MRPVSLKLRHGCFVLLAVLPRRHPSLSLSFTSHPSPINDPLTRFTELDDGRPTMVCRLDPLLASPSAITMAAYAFDLYPLCSVLTSCVKMSGSVLTPVISIVGSTVPHHSFLLLAIPRGSTKLILLWVSPQLQLSIILHLSSTLDLLPLRLSRRPTRCRLRVNGIVRPSRPAASTRRPPIIHRLVEKAARERDWLLRLPPIRYDFGIRLHHTAKIVFAYRGIRYRPYRAVICLLSPSAELVMSRVLYEALALLFWIQVSRLLFKAVLLRESLDREQLLMGAPFRLPRIRDRILMSLVATRREEAPLRRDPWRPMDLSPLVHPMDFLLLLLIEPTGQRLQCPQMVKSLKHWERLVILDTPILPLSINSPIPA